MSFLLQMSILVHPDKNQDDAERAQQAFESKYNIENIHNNCNIMYEYLKQLISCYF